MGYPTIPTESLIPYINNSRTHSEEQINQVASSMKEFGFLNPVIIDKDGGLIAGHCRTQAAKKLGITEVPYVMADHLTEAQKKAYIIADNKLALNSGWDMGLLKLEIEGLKDLNFDSDILGFDESELASILGLEDFSIDSESSEPSDIEELSLHVTFKSEMEQQKIYEELISRGYECKILG